MLSLTVSELSSSSTVNDLHLAIQMLIQKPSSGFTRTFAVSPCARHDTSVGSGRVRPASPSPPGPTLHPWPHPAPPNGSAVTVSDVDMLPVARLQRMKIATLFSRDGTAHASSSGWRAPSAFHELNCESDRDRDATAVAAASHPSPPPSPVSASASVACLLVAGVSAETANSDREFSGPLEAQLDLSPGPSKLTLLRTSLSLSSAPL